MEYNIGRKISVPSMTATPFAIATSSCNVIAAVTLQGVHLFVSFFLFLLINSCLLSTHVSALDFTTSVFGDRPVGSLAAFGDFNSDKLTDIFILDHQQESFSILLAYPQPPFLRLDVQLSCSFKGKKIAALVPGDFDGDAAMDVLVLTNQGNTNHYDVYIAWGALTQLTCPDTPLLHVYGHPLVLDYNKDMIADLFGLDGQDKNRTFWIFNNNRTVDRTIQMGVKDRPLRIPHSHGFADLDGDLSADLLLTTTDGYELWEHVKEGFEWDGKSIPLPVKGASHTGQSVFLDLDSNGRLDHLVPVCVDSKCTNSSFFIFTGTQWKLVECDLKEPTNGESWTFHPPDPERPYLEAVTARSGDFNLDGFPDLLVTLTRAGYKEPRAVLLENTEGGRKLIPRWDLLSQWNNGTSVLASAFYDVQEKGTLDVLLVQENGRMAAYENGLDYDANFIKVLVLTGRCYANCSHGRIPYGTNLPGPSISYSRANNLGVGAEGRQLAVGAQLSQSAYHALQLPYTLFGLGRSPNFVETLSVGLDKSGRDWTQIIPNSQMIIIPTLDGHPASWLNKLFVTPSRAIVLSAAALAGFGFLLAVAVAILHCRERRADKLEQLAVANRFHFDAM